MRNSLRGLDTYSWIDGEPGVVSNAQGVSHFRAEWQAARAAERVEIRKCKTRYNRFQIYHLPNGAQVTTEQLVIHDPLHRLFADNVREFSIFDIQMHVYLTYDILLSRKQVRDALYRLNHSKLLFRHIGKGIYTWLL